MQLEHLLAVRWRVSRPHPTGLRATCRWFHKHRSSITALRLECLHSEKAAAGLRASFVLVLLGILSTTLKTLVVNNCGQVCRALPLWYITALGVPHER